MKSHLFLCSLVLISMFNTGCVNDQIKKCCEEPAETSMLDSIKVRIPTAFTPDGDAFNDVFRPMVRELGSATMETAHLEVKNALGQIKYNEMVNLGWDGKHEGYDVPHGVYTYTFTFTTSLGNTETLSGKVALVRPLDGCDGIDVSQCLFEDAILQGDTEGGGSANNSDCQ